MRIPIAYALDYPNRLDDDFGRADFTQTMKMDFQPPDLSRFPALRLAYEALEKGGTAPAVLNGADEAAVALFLSERIRFSQISEIIEEALRQHQVVENPDLEDILKADHWAKEFVREMTESH